MYCMDSETGMTQMISMLLATRMNGSHLQIAITSMEVVTKLRIG